MVGATVVCYCPGTGDCVGMLSGNGLYYKEEGRPVATRDEGAGA